MIAAASSYFERSKMIYVLLGAIVSIVALSFVSLRAINILKEVIEEITRWKK